MLIEPLRGEDTGGEDDDKGGASGSFSQLFGKLKKNKYKDWRRENNRDGTLVLRTRRGFGGLPGPEPGLPGTIPITIPAPQPSPPPGLPW